MDFEKILWLSSLIFFNTFCILGIFLIIVIIAFINKISQHTDNLRDYTREKLDSLESGFNDWSWLIVPAASLLGGLNFGKKKPKRNKKNSQRFAWINVN